MNERPSAGSQEQNGGVMWKCAPHGWCARLECFLEVSAGVSVCWCVRVWVDVYFCETFQAMEV